MAIQSFIRRGTASNATARRLIEASDIAQHILDATVEITNDTRDIIYKNGKYGKLFLVRSPKFATRYYIVKCRAGVWSCDAQNASYFIRLAQTFLSQIA